MCITRVKIKLKIKVGGRIPNTDVLLDFLFTKVAFYAILNALYLVFFYFSVFIEKTNRSYSAIKTNQKSPLVAILHPYEQYKSQQSTHSSSSLISLWYISFIRASFRNSLWFQYCSLISFTLLLLMFLILVFHHK